MERGLGLALRRRLQRRNAGTGRRNPVLIPTVLVGLALGAAAIGILELRLRPVVEQLAVRQVNNHVTRRLNQALAETGMLWDGVAELHTDQNGQLTAITHDMARVNSLKADLTQTVLDTVENLDVQQFSVPLGSLFDMDLLWAKGPKLQVHGLAVGTVETHVYSEITAAGINQNLHRLWVDLNVPLTVLLPGMSGHTQVNTRLCVSETVIVGRVPQAYLSTGKTEE